MRINQTMIYEMRYKLNKVDLRVLFHFYITYILQK